MKPRAKRARFDFVAPALQYLRCRRRRPEHIRLRGATVDNILNFEKFDNARVIKLEQNYRSTSHILDAANAVIKNNVRRKGKMLWTDRGQGSKIVVYEAEDEQSEGAFVADTVLKNVAKGHPLGCAYRALQDERAVKHD